MHHIEATQVKGQDGKQDPVCPHDDAAVTEGREEARIMPKYTITEVHRYTYEVEADSPREARQKFMAMDSGEAEDAQQSGEVEKRTFEGPDPATGQVDSWDDDEFDD